MSADLRTQRVRWASTATDLRVASAYRSMLGSANVASARVPSSLVKRALSKEASSSPGVTNMRGAVSWHHTIESYALPSKLLDFQTIRRHQQALSEADFSVLLTREDERYKGPRCLLQCVSSSCAAPLLRVTGESSHASMRPMLSEGLPDRVLHFVQRCQVLVGQWCETQWSRRTASVSDCLNNVPTPATSTERAAMVQLLADVAAHVIADLDAPRLKYCRFMGRLSNESHTDAALRIVAFFCTMPAMRLTLVAEAVGLSPSYLSRLLAYNTHCSFPHHVHTFRILRAVRLLSMNTYSTKEVAGAVGYQWTSDLDRHFVHRMHLRPREFRVPTQFLASK
jgi:AraC-like DNA-binding protein